MPSYPWGSGYWGLGNWGEGNQDVIVQFAAWGQGTWGENTWGIGYVTTALSTNVQSVIIAIDNEVLVTGQQLNSTVNTVSITADANLTLSTNLLQISLGDESEIGNANVILTALNILNTTIGAYSITADGNTSEIVVGDSMTSAIGNVDAGAGALVFPTGQQLTIAIGDESLTGDASVTLTTNLLNTTTGTATGDVATLILTGVSSTISIGSVSFTIDGSVTLTGVSSTISTGKLFITAWAVIDINSTATWTVVDIAA